VNRAATRIRPDPLLAGGHLPAGGHL